MALPLDTTGTAVSNRVVNELHAVGTLEQRYIIPDKGTFFVNKTKVYNDATGLLLEPVTDYMILQLSIEASNLILQETSQIIYVSNPSVVRVRLNYQAVGGQFESIHARVRPLIDDFISGKISNRIFGGVAGEAIELSPRDFLSTSRVLNGGNMLYVQLSNIAEAITSNDPSAAQAVYEFLINYTKGVRQEYTDRIAQTRNRIDQVFKSTEIVDGQYLFTHEDLNPFVYLNYGKWQNNPNLLFWGGPKDANFGDVFGVSNEQGLFAMRTMAYRRNDAGSGISFQLTANKSDIGEGETVEFTLTAPGLAAGTRIPFVISGVQSKDIVGGSLIGQFILNAQGAGVIQITTIEDEETDGDMQMVVRLQQSPDVFATVRVRDTSQRITYRAFFSSDENGTRVIQSADEGTTAYLQIRTTGVMNDLTVFLLYDGSSITAADVDGPLASTVVISGNKATVPYRFVNDFTTEGNETLIANICRTMNIASMVVRTTLQVNDTSKTPTLTMFFAAASGGNDPITSINEGQQGFLKIRTTNVPDGGQINLTYSGTATAADFTTALPSRVSVLNNEVTVIYQAANDGITEGDETFTVTAAVDAARSVSDTKSLIIRDTSVGYTLDSVFYSNSADGSQVITSGTIPTNVYLCIRTKGFSNGEQAHVDFNTSDPQVKALLSQTTGLIRVNQNFGSLLITLEDSRGQYTQVSQLRAVISTYSNNTIGNQLGTAVPFPVNPRAVPTARLTAMDVNNNPVTSIGEGQTLKIRIDTTNIPNGANALPVKHGGTATADDFNNVLPNAVVITNGVGWLEYSIKADGKLEGTETFIVTVDLPYGGGSSSVQVNILDTSLPVANVRWTSDVAGNNQISTINEGSTAYLQVRTSGFNDGTVLQLRYSGTASDSDVVGGLPKTLTVVSGAAVVAYNFANDFTEEGDETLTVNLAYQSVDLNSGASIIIADTSVPGPTEIKWSRSSNPNDAVGNIVFAEGETAYLHIRAMNLPLGTELQMTYNGTADATDFIEGLPNVIPTTGEWTTRPFAILEDNTEEPGANELLYATVTYRARSVSTTSPMGIMDTSKYLMVTNGESKTIRIAPGETYYVILIGAGGGGGRGIASNTKNGAEGDGTIGGMSMVQVNTIDGVNSYRVNAYGGGAGRGVPIHSSDTDGSNMHEAWRAYPGGWLADHVAGTGQSFLSNVPVYRFNGMDGGTTKGIASNVLFASNYDIGHSQRGIIDIPWNANLPLAVRSVLASGYGNGGAGGAGMGPNTSCSGTGGSAGGVWCGAFTNPTGAPINLTLTSGKNGQAYQPSAPIGTRGADGGTGCGIAFKLGSNVNYNPIGSNLTTMDVSTVTGSLDLGSLKNVVVPVGKRLRLSFQSSVTNEPSGTWAVQDLLAVREYGGVVFNTANADNMSFVRTNRNGQVGVFSVESYDSQNCFKNGFKFIAARLGWRGARGSNPTQFLPYYRGLGLGEGENYDPKRYGFPGSGTVVANSTGGLLTQADSEADSYRGTLSGNGRADGWSRIHAIVENRTTNRIVLIPFTILTGTVAYTGRVFYTLEDI